MTTEFANIALDLIEPSLTNPRKTFNPTKLAELTESIKASGVHQPALVRPLPGSRVADTPRGVQYELVCGERRYRASVDAGVATIPALVRALTDEQVLEIQIVENLIRDDLTELEEADDGVPNIANDTPRMGVKVRISAQHLHPKQQKFAGKEGTITGKVGDAWDVTFRGRSGGISSFMSDQISVVLV